MAGIDIGTMSVGVELINRSNPNVFTNIEKQIQSIAAKLGDGFDTKAVDKFMKDLYTQIGEYNKRVSELKSLKDLVSIDKNAVDMNALKAAENQIAEFGNRIKSVLNGTEASLQGFFDTTSGAHNRFTFFEAPKGLQLLKDNIDSLAKSGTTYGKALDMLNKLETATAGKGKTQAEKDVIATLRGYVDAVNNFSINPKALEDRIKAGFDIKTVKGMFDNVMSDRTASDKMVQNYASACNQIDGYIGNLKKRLDSLNEIRPFQNIPWNNLTLSQKLELDRYDKEKKKIEGQIKAWEDLKKIKSGATSIDRLDAITTRGAHNDVMRTTEAFIKQVRVQDHIDKASSRNAQSYEIAQAKLDRYIKSLERYENQLMTTLNHPGVKNNAVLNKNVSDALDRVTAVKDIANMIRGDRQMATNRLDWAHFITDYRGAALGATDMRKLASREQAQYDREVNKSAKERKAAYDQIVDAKRKLETEYSKTGDRKKTMLPGVDSTAFDKARQNISDLIEKYKEWIRLLESGKSLSDIGFNKSTVRRERKDSLAEMAVAKSDVTTQEKLIREQERAAKAAERLANSNKGLAESKRAVAAAARQNAQTVSKLISEYERLSKSTSKAQISMNGLKDLFMQFAPVYGLQQAVTSIIEIGGEIEKQHIALQSILGDLYNANEMFSQIKNLALESPFKFGELNKDVKQLAAYNVETDQLYDTTKRLADISSGLGVSFERIALAYGQVKARSWLDGKELRQFAYAGVPLLQSLADMYTKTQGKKVTTSQVKKMISAREVSFEDVQSILWEMTDEGGKFFNMQKVLSETLLGRYNKLIDAWEIMLSGFAKGDSIIGGTMKTIIDWITKLVLSINTIAPALLAAFAPRILKNLLPMATFAKGGMMTNLLASKKAEADSIRKNLATGKLTNGNMTAYQREVLATENKITNCEARRLAIANAIGKAELRQLYAKGQINKATYLALANEGRLMSMYSITGKIGMKAAIGMKNIWSGITGMFGGPWMMGITAAIGAITYFYQKAEETKNAINKMQEEMLERFLKIRDLLSGDDFWGVYDAGSDKERLDMIKTYADQLKEINFDRYGYVMSNALSISDTKERLLYLRQELETMKRANEMAKNYVSTFNSRIIKKAFEGAKDAASEYNRTLSNIKQNMDRMRDSDYQRIVKTFEDNGYVKQAEALKFMLKNENLSREDINNSIRHWAFANMSKIDFNAIGLKMFGDFKDANKYLDKYAKAISESIKNILPNIGKDPTVNETYRQLREELLSLLEFTPEEKNTLNSKLDMMLGIISQDEAGNKLAETVSEKLNSSMDESIKIIALKFRNQGFDALNIAEKEVVRKLMDESIKEIEANMPNWAPRLQELLDDQTFYAHVQLVTQKDATDLYKAIMPKILEYGSDGKKSKLAKVLETWTKEGSLTAARQAAKKAVEESEAEVKRLEDQIKSPKGKDLGPRLKAEKENLEFLKEAQTYVGIDPEKDKKSGTDKLLQDWETYLQLLKDMRTEYEKELKHWGKTKANAMVSSRKEFKPLFDALGVKKLNASEYEANARLFEKVAQRVLGFSTPQRRKYQGRVSREVEDSAFLIVDSDMKATIEANKESLSILMKQYDNYDKLVKTYGKTTASMLSFYNGRPSIGLEDKMGNLGDLVVMKQGIRRVEALRSLITNELGNLRTMDGIKDGLENIRSIEDIKNLNKDKLKDLFGDEATGSYIHDLINQLKEEEQKMAQNSFDTIVAIMDANKSLATELGRVNAELADQIKKINDNQFLSKEQKDEYIHQATLDADTKKLKMSPMYKNFFERSFAMTFNNLSITAEKVRNNLEKQFNNGRITAEEYAKGIDDVNKTMAQFNKRTSKFFRMLKGGLNGYAQERIDDGRNIIAMAKQMQDLLKAGKEEEAKALYEDINKLLGGQLDDFSDKLEIAARNAEKLGKNMNEAGNNILAASNNIASIVSSVSSMVQGVMDSYNTLNEWLQSEGDDSLEYSDVKGYLDATQAATSGYSKAFQALASGDPGGFISGLVSGTVGPITALNKHHDKKLQHQIELLQLQNTILQNGFNNLKRDLEGRMGSVYSANGQLDYVGMKESYENQLANAREILRNEEDKKDSDDSAIEDYKQQIKDLEYTLQHFTEDMMKDLYGIDFQAWAGQLASALQSAWESGASAAKAYSNVVSDVLKQTATNVIQKKYIEAQLEPIMDAFMQAQEYSNGQLDDTSYELLAKMYSTAENAVNSAYNLYDSIDEIAKKSGNTIKSSSTGMSASISGVTEDTADLLGSYVNNIRLDLAVNRENLTKMVEEDIPAFTKTIGRMEANLISIQANTYKSSVSAGQIYNLLYDLTQGRAKMTVSTK